MQYKNQIQERSAFRGSLNIDERIYLLKISDSNDKGFIKAHIERFEQMIEDSMI
jgi:hypothetical protein